MYVDLGFQVYSLSEGASKAFQASFTVWKKHTKTYHQSCKFSEVMESFQILGKTTNLTSASLAFALWEVLMTLKLFFFFK